MSSTSQMAILQMDVQELEQMNGSLLDRISSLESELGQEKAQTKAISSERDELRHKLLTVQEEDVRAAFLELERLDGLLRNELEHRAELESQLAMHRRADVEKGLAHSFEVSELERMNALLAVENAKLLEKINKVQASSQYKPEFNYKPEPNAEPCAEPEQEQYEIDDLSAHWEYYIAKHLRQ
eukprot:gnl/MRDRNA2_/MRDRNA2_75210_c0_seq1.p1 gnl/MRDRNA2_/MRDRNA2_75210_c0~~gnl/MRDRNA2_/MRDRNA2_75210_c0_seq1.p1  ORF type:complete len:183 (-),score=58.01 gnl/MRDRNA2_/MRDRNA2_75210_c0_seq1:15-563(-)